MMTPPLETLAKAPRKECQEKMIPAGVIREYNLTFSHQQQDYIYKIKDQVLSLTMGNIPEAL